MIEDKGYTYLSFPDVYKKVLPCDHQQFDIMVQIFFLAILGGVSFSSLYSLLAAMNNLLKSK